MFCTRFSAKVEVSSLLSASSPFELKKQCYDNVISEYVVKLRACLPGGRGPQMGEVTCGGSPHLSCEHNQIEMRVYLDRRLARPKRAGVPHLHVKTGPKASYYVL